MSDKCLNAFVRPEKGKNNNRRTRNEGFIPAILYSHGESDSIKIPQKEFFDLFKGNISESIIFDLKIKDAENEKQMAFVKSYQMNPETDQVIHLDLFKVTAGELITTQVAIKIFGEPKGTKLGGVLEVTERFIEVECLPKDLPEIVEVDVTELMPGDSIHAKDIKIADSVNLLTSADAVIVALHTLRAAESDEEGVGEAAEGEAAESSEE